MAHIIIASVFMKVAWIVVRELRLRDRSLIKIAQGASPRFRNKTPYVGANKDGMACGLLIDGENVRIFLPENNDLSVSGSELPVEEVDSSLYSSGPSNVCIIYFYPISAVFITLCCCRVTRQPRVPLLVNPPLLIAVAYLIMW